MAAEEEIPEFLVRVDYEVNGNPMSFYFDDIEEWPDSRYSYAVFEMNKRAVVRTVTRRVKPTPPKENWS